MDINYELYRAFYHVAVTLSFSEASKQLFISQPVVSQSTKVLEKRLNQTSFTRSARRVQSTPEEEILFKHIEPVINLTRQGENQLLEVNTLNGGQLRIGASDTICRYYLLPYLSQLYKMYPHVHIEVTDQTSIECTRLLKYGRAGFAIISHPNSVLSTAHIPRVLREFRDVFVANQECFPFQDRVMSPPELQPYPILVLDRKGATSEFLHAMSQKSQLNLVPEIEFSSNDLLTDLTRIGPGIASVPDFYIPGDDRDLFVLKLEQDLSVRQIMVAFNENLSIPRAARQSTDIL